MSTWSCNDITQSANSSVVPLEAHTSRRVHLELLAPWPPRCLCEPDVDCGVWPSRHRGQCSALDREVKRLQRCQLLFWSLVTYMILTMQPPLKLQQLQHPVFLQLASQTRFKNFARPVGLCVGLCFFSDNALNVYVFVSRVPYFPIGPKPKCCPKKT